MEAKKYFESIRNHVKRARELESRAEELRNYADNISGMRYDRPEVGKQKMVLFILMRCMSLICD